MSNAMGSSAKVPAPDPLPQEAEEIRRQEGLSLQQMSGLLSEGQAQSKETREILGGISGLYSPIVKATEESRVRKFDDAKIGGWVDQIQKNPFTRIDEIVDPGALETLQKAGVDTSRSWEAHGKNRGDVITKVQNLNTLEDVTPATSTTEMQLNQGALADLRSKYQSNIDYESQIGEAARGDILDWINREPTEYEKAQGEIGLLQSQRQLAALKGEGPISEATRQRKAEEFNLLKENLARSGNEIQGDTPENAVGLSTAGNEALGEFNRTWGLREDTERRGELSQGEAATLARYGVSSDMGARDLGMTSGFASQYTPGATQMGLLSGMPNSASFAGQYGNMSGMYGNALSSYLQQQGMNYQSAYDNAALKSQDQAAMWGLLGTLGGSALGGWAGNWGKAAGAAANSATKKPDPYTYETTYH